MFAQRPNWSFTVLQTGALPYFGTAWYRKRFVVPEPARGRFHSLEIDGAMSNATVFLNGRELGRRPYGYVGFAVDLTPHLATRFGAAAVRLASEGKFDRMVALQAGNIVDVALLGALAIPRRVDLHGDAVITARGIGISFGDQ